MEWVGRDKCIKGCGPELVKGRHVGPTSELCLSPHF